MKIGHYSPWMLAPGGVQSYLRRIVRGQLARGHEVTLFNRPDLVPCELGSAFGTEIVTTHDDDELLESARSRVLDVLHAHTAVDVTIDGPGAILGLALVRTLHGHEAYCPSGTRHFARPTSRPCPRGCHLVGCTWGHIFNRCGSVRPKEFIHDFRRVARERRSAKHFFSIAISHFTKEQMVRAGYDAAAIRVILHPAPDLPLNAEPGGGPTDQVEPPRFLFLGRLVPGKGLDWLIRAVERLSDRVEADFEIVGDGPERERLAQLCSQLGVAHRFTWMGWLDETAIVKRLAVARAVIFPSLWHEPAGLVMLEAAASGRAVIASRVGGIPEYAETLGNVRLVEPGEVDSLAAAIRLFASDPELVDRLGQTGRQRIRDGALNLEGHLRQLEETYTSVIGHASAAADRRVVEASLP